ncbi:hypothetical protein FA15DRAFT_548727, partial [Coprinopsis marcescibilis]
ETCAGCALQPDTSSAFMGTYRETTYHPESVLHGTPTTPSHLNIVFCLSGTAIYVYFILANYGYIPEITVNTNCNFILDGVLTEQPFNHDPKGPTAVQFEYHRLVFARSNLSNIHHVLEIRVEGFDFSSYINFDYAVY